MNFSRIKFLLLTMLITASCNGLFAASVSITATGSASQTDMNNLAAQINSNGDFQKLGKLSDFARGMADTQTATAVNGGSLFAYQNYELFSISAGYMAAFQLPTLSGNASDAIEDDLKDDGDTYAGADGKFTYVNIGVNTSFIVPNTYMNFKMGGININEDNIKIKSRFYALGLNYSFISASSAPSNIFKWRGISLKTGIVYQETDSKFRLDFDSVYTEGAYSYDLEVDLHSESKTVTIPLEVSTSQQLLWIFNVALGAGVDINFGKSDLTVEADDVKDGSGNQAGIVTVNGTNVSGESPSMFRPKIMAAAGLNLGPVKIDAPFYYYPSSGWAFGFTAAVVF